jgi:hypothetical protein
LGTERFLYREVALFQRLLYSHWVGEKDGEDFLVPAL